MLDGLKSLFMPSPLRAFMIGMVFGGVTVAALLLA